MIAAAILPTPPDLEPFSGAVVLFLFATGLLIAAGLGDYGIPWAQRWLDRHTDSQDRSTRPPPRAGGALRAVDPNHDYLEDGYVSPTSIPVARIPGRLFADHPACADGVVAPPPGARVDSPSLCGRSEPEREARSDRPRSTSEARR